MATKTRTDLINQALAQLGVLAAGQTADAEDYAAVNEHVDPLVATLDALGVVTVDDTDAIPIEWFLSLAALLADRAADHFGLVGLPSSPSSPNPAAAALQELCDIVYARPTFEPQRGEYF